MLKVTVRVSTNIRGPLSKGGIEIPTSLSGKLWTVRTPVAGTLIGIWIHIFIYFTNGYPRSTGRQSFSNISRNDAHIPHWRSRRLWNRPQCPRYLHWLQSHDWPNGDKSSTAYLCHPSVNRSRQIRKVGSPAGMTQQPAAQEHEALTKERQVNFERFMR